MLTIKQIRDDKQAAIRKLAKKGVDAAPVIARIETLDDRRKRPSCPIWTIRWQRRTKPPWSSGR